MNLIKFQFERKEIRTVTVNEKPVFVAKDVCDVLGIKGMRDAMGRLDADERESVVVDTLGGKQRVNAVNESGLYGLIFQSRKPEAQKFRKWVTSEVLPSIRRDGGYIKPNVTPEQIEKLMKNIAALALENKHYRELAELQEKIAETWKARCEYGEISESNGLPRRLKRRGTWVADRNFRDSIIHNFEQMLFQFKD